MDVYEFLNELRDLLVEGDLESGIAGVTQQDEADQWLIVSMQDGSEFSVAVTKQ